MHWRGSHKLGKSRPLGRPIGACLMVERVKSVPRPRKPPQSGEPKLMPEVSDEAPGAPAGEPDKESADPASIPIERALADRQLLGAAIGDLSTWQTWIATIKAAYGRPLDPAERSLFDAVAGGRSPPTRKVRELVAVCSRRSGKGRIGSALAVHEAVLVDHSAALSPGETGVVAIVSPTLAQSRVMLDYVVGYLEASPVLRAEIAKVTDDAVELRNGNVIVTLASDYRSLRGRTLLGCLLDEASFLRDELSRASDLETARAVLPGLMTTGGMLVILSSPYRRAGLVYTRHRDHFGKDSADCLVVAGPSSTFNPTLDAGEIERARESDPEAAQSEWLGQFRSDLAMFLSEELIEQAIDRSRPLELPPQLGVRYSAFADPSGGRGDHFVVVIGHRAGEGFVCDAIRGYAPPFNTKAVVVDLARNLLDDYGITAIAGDNYSAAWVADAFRAEGVKYVTCETPKSALYIESLPLWTRGAISIPEHPRLVRELRLLERRTSRSGRDSVDHGQSGSDDYANALCGCAVSCASRRRLRQHWTPIVTKLREGYQSPGVLGRKGSPGNPATIGHVRG